MLSMSESFESIRTCVVLDLVRLHVLYVCRACVICRPMPCRWVNMQSALHPSLEMAGGKAVKKSQPVCSVRRERLHDACCQASTSPSLPPALFITLPLIFVPTKHSISPQGKPVCQGPKKGLSLRPGVRHVEGWLSSLPTPNGSGGLVTAGGGA
ncbi:hypothetical protein BGZ63DRAFT_369167 [Mariannaea sp. PMI_226]|nr:hypothetical protein BGZ63DRAFT_369167 [Mariannaea sp. PMI_226]